MATAVIRYEPSVDEPLPDIHNPSQLFEDRANTFDEFSGSFALYGLDHESSKKSLSDIVCDAIWDMGFDVKPDFFESVYKVSKLRNAPLVCELIKEHQKLGTEMLNSLDDLKRIKFKRISTVSEPTLSRYTPPPPQFMVHFKNRLGKNPDAKAILVDALKSLGINASVENIAKAYVVIDKYNCIIGEISSSNIAEKFYNFRNFVHLIEKCPVKSISFYRECNDYYYDKMLVITGLNSKRKDCLKLFQEVCEDLGIAMEETDVTRCEWLYGKAFQSKALRSPLVVQFASEDKRIAVYQASKEEGKIRKDLRLKVKPRKRRMSKRPDVEEAEAEQVDAKEENPNKGEPIYRRVYINPLISMPHSLLYTATKDFAKRSKRFLCLPMSFYGRIRLELKEPKPNPANEDENAASAVDELAEKMKALTIDGKTLQIKSPLDLWNLDKRFKSNAIDKYYMVTDPYYKDVGYALEPYEWFSLPREGQRRLTRRQLTFDSRK